MQTIEKHLRAYAELKHREDSLKRQWDLTIEEKESRIERTSRPLGERINHPRKIADPTFDIVCDIVRLYDTKINSLIAQLFTVQDRISDIEYELTSASLSKEEWDFIKVRFIEDCTMEETAGRIGYSLRHARRIKARLYNKIKDVRFMSA